VRWIYGNAYGKTKYLLETYALDKGLGVAGVRRLITEFRARLALLDMKKWSNEIKSLLNQNFGSNTYWEQDYWDNGKYSYTWKMTPYQTVTASGEYLVPNQDITPGWSGANYIPLKVQSGAKQVTVSFYPNGSNSNNTNMNFLICYRATDGTPVYSEPITGEGSVTLRLDKAPSSTGGTQMVFAVVVNTDYQYTGNTDIRKKHFDYKLKLEEGISGAGDAYTKYYNDFKLDYAWPEIGASEPESSSSQIPTSSSSENITGMIVLRDGLKGPATHMNLVYRNGFVDVQYMLPQNDKVKVSLFTGFGALVGQKIVGEQGMGAHSFAFDMHGMPRGTYIVKVSTGSYREAKAISILK
jgi:hypothetical protein